MRGTRRTRGTHRSARSIYSECSKVTIEILEARRLFTRFAIAGDFAETSAFNDVSAMMENWNPAHILSLGDNNNNDDADLDGTIGVKFHEWMSPYLGNMGAGSSSGNRFWPTVGNHDWDGGINNYTGYFTLPGKERYYNIKLGEVEFFMLDSDQREPDGASSTSTQATWLRNALAASTAPWQIVLMHHPPYSSATTPDNTWMRWAFKDWGADAIMSGHDHLYERLNVNGLPTFIVGTGGAGLHELESSRRSDSQFGTDSQYGAVQLDATSSQLVFRFFNRSGSLLDSLTVNGGGTSPPPPPPPPPGTSTTFIPTGSSWKYLDNGSNQGSAWRAVSFSDATWKTGNAQLGYGDGDEATVVSYGGNSSNKFVTTYFRKGFSVADKSVLTGLNLRLKRDDGAVVYLNGTEVFRSNMPTGTVSSTTFASASIEDEAYKTATVNPALLVNGTNVISVEVHQGDLSSSDVSFDFALTGMLNSTSPPPPPPPPPPPSGGVYLSDLAWASATNGWGPVEKDRSVGGSGSGDGRTITLNGVTYTKGLGAHAVSDIVYNLNGAYSTFLSDIGVDDETGPGTVRFRVFADGVQIYDSGNMTQTSTTRSINVSVAGVQQLRLRVDNGGDNVNYDHADWAGARVVSASSSSVTALRATSTATLFSTTPVSNEEDDLLSLLG